MSGTVEGMGVAEFKEEEDDALGHFASFGPDWIRWCLARPSRSTVLCRADDAVEMSRSGNRVLWDRPPSGMISAEISREPVQKSSPDDGAARLLRSWGRCPGWLQIPPARMIRFTGGRILFLPSRFLSSQVRQRPFRKGDEPRRVPVHDHGGPDDGVEILLPRSVPGWSAPEFIDDRGSRRHGCRLQTSRWPPVQGAHR